HKVAFRNGRPEVVRPSPAHIAGRSGQLGREIDRVRRMFGIIRPCRNRLGDELRASWMAHLCGMCLALRDEHGQLARMVTNYDGVVVSALVEAQSPAAPGRRPAGPCPLRGMRTARVSTGPGARLAATASPLLASAKVA